ncbi:MAG: magnesium and cobalt transport protein CorA [Nitrospirae bacterium GWC2_57_13]|nr:MAG: magnesium and cobalt transport protein CorA [Nitrospirae bacterium GWC2_57_13]OGW40667.1 MAG: magnesium and cobalt transport protein CorA [Nitrospirae bacterium GWD2_57_8]
MTRSAKKRTRKAGLPPGTLLYTGEAPAHEVKLGVVRYDEAHFDESEAKTAEDCLPVAEKGAVTWVDVNGVHDVEVIRKLGEAFGLHPLVAEDIVNTDQRPKLEDYGDYVYIVLKMLYRDESRWIRAEQVSIVLGRGFVLSFHEGRSAASFAAIRERLRNDRGRLRKAGADFLLHALLDAVVDHYFVVMEDAGEQIESLEEHLLGSPTQATLRSLHLYKRKLIFLRRSVWPLREVLASLERGDSPLIAGAARTYLRDVYDHTIQVIETIEAYRDILGGMLDIYLTGVNNRMNEIMKVLTIIATIFMPLTFVVGIYGMNFRRMPELDWTWGYPAVMALLILISFGMLIFFRRKKWI